MANSFSQKAGRFISKGQLGLGLIKF
ncbi:hypothetical protein MED121_15969 [Marinomonas sp. MED121]|nr:hypothetical protein MED121_15969 [Marinomonas sp. MED121]